jgi:type 2 lantibiotic biosynthesis protein LanM
MQTSDKLIEVSSTKTLEGTFWNKIIISCSTADEILKHRYFLSVTKGQKGLAKRLKKVWLSQLNNSENILQSRLGEFNPNSISVDELCLNLVGQFQIVDHEDRPDWVKSMEKWVIPVRLKISDKLPNDLITKAKDIPFRFFILSYVDFLHRALLQNSFYSTCMPLQQAIISLAIARLGEVILPTLVADYRQFHRFLKKKLKKPLVNQTVLKIYERQICESEYPTLYCKYPVLSRLIAIECEKIHYSFSKFARDFTRALPSLRGVFTSLTDLHAIQEIKFGLSDPHNNGATVAIVKTDRESLVYKPRNLKSAKVLQSFLDMLNKNVGFDFYLRKIVEFADHGWEEFIGNKQCTALHDVNRFYTQAGAFQALALILGTSDCNIENIRCDSGYFHILDAEVLLHVSPKIFGHPLTKKDARWQISKILKRSVISTGLLPVWGFSKEENKVWGGAGLWSAKNDRSKLLIQNWKLPEERGATFLKKTKIKRTYNNLPVLLDEECTLYEHHKYFTDGFEVTFDYLTKLLSRDTERRLLREHLKDLRIRVLLRDTSGYDKVIQRLKHPNALRNGIRWGLELEHLYRQSDLTTPSLNSIAAEIQSLKNLEIPFFETISDRVDLITSEGRACITNCIEATALQELEAVFDLMDSSFKTIQLDLIKIITHSALNKTTIDLHTSGHTMSLAEIKSTNLATGITGLAAATKIAGTLETSLVKGKDGSINWMSLELQTGAIYRSFAPMPLNLFSGSFGIATFMSALFKATNSKKYYDLALSAIKPLIAQMRSDPRVGGQLPEINYPGLSAGIGSIIYSLVSLGNILADDQFYEMGLKLCALINPNKPHWQKSFDLLGGQAGLLIALIKLYETTGNTLPKLMAKTIAEKVEKGACGDRDGVFWPSTIGRRMAGLSHGNTGIALALAYYYKHFENYQTLRLIKDALALEDTEYLPDKQTWRDNRIGLGVDRNVAPSAWCHGTPGIIAGRMKIAELTGLKASPLVEDLSKSLRGFAQSAVDHLCCGNLGKISTGLYISDVARNNALAHSSHQKLLDLINRINYDSIVVSNLNADRSLFPGFFQGLSGVGYELIRLTHESSLPNILLFD